MKKIFIYRNLPQSIGDGAKPDENRTERLFFLLPGGFVLLCEGVVRELPTPLLNCIATVIQPTGGSIQVEGDTLQSLKEKALASTVAKKLVIYSRTLNCWTT